MLSIKADLDACQGYGNCAMNAPDLFDLNDEDVVVVLTAEVPDDRRTYVEQAVRSCPVDALAVEET